MKTIKIVNTGGTFNKCYDEISGELQVAQSNAAIEHIVESSFRGNIKCEIEGILFKDSLEMQPEDREEIAKKVKNNPLCLIVHGTDTMDLTAKYLAEQLSDEIVVLTGSMKPYSIDPIEAVSNFSTAVQFLQSCETSGVYIAMHGLVKPYTQIKKNRELGIFQCQK